jgi:LmbE family N-acetylglucosaminyl deacetylase
MPTKRLLGVFAHPNDENLMSGTLLHYHSQGVETGLVYATRGEVGEISDSTLATYENLGQVREQEMQNVASALHVPHLWFLDYRDSGMPGSLQNQDSQAFMRVHPAEAIGKLVAIIRQFHPDVIVTFDESGVYEHPDHIAVYQYTTSAFHAAADSVLYPELGSEHKSSKLYYTSFQRNVLLTMAEWLGGQADFGAVFKDLDISTLGLSDEQISVRLNVEQWQEEKARIEKMHRTQMNPNTFMVQIPEDVQKHWRSLECYQLATSRVGPDVIGENNLFARIL